MRTEDRVLGGETEPRSSKIVPELEVCGLRFPYGLSHHSFPFLLFSAGDELN